MKTVFKEVRAKVTEIWSRDVRASIDAMSEVSLEIMRERDKTEREIIRLAESGFKEEAWKLVVKHFNIKEPRTAK